MGYQKGKTVYSVHYDSSNHLGVIFQRYGSIMPKVLPYCLINMAIVAALYILRSYGIDLSITDKGHGYLTLFLAFLIVSRVTISLGRYNEARSNLGTMYRNIRELVNYIFIFTEDDRSESAKKWRHNTTYQSILLLRLVMSVIDYPDDKIPGWEIPELHGESKDFLLENMDTRRRWAHVDDRGEAEDNMRIPIRMAFKLRSTIYSNKDFLQEEYKLGAWQIGKLFGEIDSFMAAYYGMRKFMTTPFPFPLVQMARTFLFLYLYTLPFALLTDESNVYVHMCVIFLVTYGFMGLEITSIEFDNPFGHDANDFDNLGMAKTAFEDTYVTVYDVDGTEWADKLRAKMKGPDDEGQLPSERTWLLSTNIV